MLLCSNMFCLGWLTILRVQDFGFAALFKHVLPRQGWLELHELVLRFPALGISLSSVGTKRNKEGVERNLRRGLLAEASLPNSLCVAQSAVPLS